MATFETSLETTTAILIVIYAFYGCVITPLQIYYGYKFWKLKQLKISFITKRHASLVITNVVLFNLYPLIFRPISDFTYLYGILGAYHPVQLFCANAIQFNAMVLVTRLWLLYYDYNHELHTLSKKWTTEITQNQDLYAWTIKYRWMGNITYLSIIGIIITSIIMIVAVGGSSVFPEYTNYWQLSGSLPIISVLILAFQIRKCRDNLCIKREFKLNGIFMFIFCAYYAVVVVLFEVDSNIRAIATNLSSCIFLYALGFGSTYWVIRQYKKQTVGDKMLKRMSSYSFNGNHNWPLRDILASKDGFDLFANHLVNEFSTESLFFVFEVMQFKRQTMKLRVIKEDDVGVMVSINEELLDRLRRKDGKIENVSDFNLCLVHIMQEYIYSHSPHSVNLSSATRSAIVYEFNNMMTGKDDIERYIVLFDEAVKEIINLLQNDSLIRFYGTHEYQQLVQCTPKSRSLPSTPVTP